MSGIRSFLADRLGWEKHLKPFLEKPLPPQTGWTDSLGSVIILLFILQVVTGIILAMYYNPSPEHAYQSIHYILEEVALGSVLQALHHWGAGFMLIFVALHLVINFFHGSFKAPREITWISGVLLFLLTLGFSFTGYLLPWDLKAYWATLVGVELVKDVPLIGEFIGRLLLGGESVSGFTLTRFYALHVFVLPAFTALFICVHLYLVRLHDIAGSPGKEGKSGSPERFYPEHLFRSSIVFGLVFIALLFFVFWVEVPLEEPAGTLDPDYVPRPEWFFMGLFLLLTYFPGRFEFIASFVLPVLGILLLFLIPFLSRNTSRKPSERPFALAAGITAIAAVVYLTAMGVADSRPYGGEIILPKRSLTPNEAHGLSIYMQRDCAYCHATMGRGGRRAGPDMNNVADKSRSKEWLVEFVRDPQAVSRWTVMPSYDLPDEELQLLAEFLLALDYSKFGTVLLTKEQAEEIVRKNIEEVYQ